MDLSLKNPEQNLSLDADNYIQHTKIEWSIKNLPQISEHDIIVESSRITLKNFTTWFLVLETQFKREVAILHLHRCQKDNGPQKVFVSFRFGLKEGTKEIWFDELNNEFQAGNFKLIFASLSRYSKNNQVVVLCQMMVVTEFANMTELYGESSKISFMSDFYNLRKTGYLSDFTLQISGTFIKVHKAILTERSIFFRNLLFHEKYILSFLNLEDENLNEINHMLAFMYSGNLNTWIKNSSMKLSAYDCLVKFKIVHLPDLLVPVEIKLVSEYVTKTIELTWQLDLLNCRNPDYVSISPTFDTALGSIHFMHHPKTLTEKDTITVTVETSAPIQNIGAACINLSLLDSQGTKHHHQTSTNIMKLESAFKTCFKIDQEFILNIKSHLLPEEVLTICCQIETAIYEEKERNVRKRYVNRNVQFLSFASLLESANFSDFSILAGDQTFRVHKAILAARSNFFHRLFMNYKEKSITIVDLKSSTLKILLSYMYSGEITLDIDSALELQKNSNKYSVTLLSYLLDHYFRSKCNPGDVCELISKADFWNVENAKYLALDFLTLNFNVIQKSKNWKHFVAQNKELASEILLKISGDRGASIIKA